MICGPYLKERLTCATLALASFLALPVWCTLLHCTGMADALHLPAMVAQDATGVLLGMPAGIVLGVYLCYHREDIYDPRSYVST